MQKKHIRFIFMLVVGILISFLLDLLKQSGIEQHHKIFDILTSILITILVWEGNLRIDHWMNLKFPWVSKPGKRILVHLPVSIIYSASVIYVAMLGFNKYLCTFPESTRSAFMVTSIVIGVMVSIILLSVEIGFQFFKSWKTSLVEIERYKTENIAAQLQNLKNQINPHFLFNNLSVLSSLVYQDQDKAAEFINQLSKVYRYLLENRNSKLVTLADEMEFVTAYNSLLKIRFDKNINFGINIPDDKLYYYLPVMAIQMLIENAIKHNEISSDQPLHIKIEINDETIEITNNLQLRSHVEPSSKTGLQNIRDRYLFYTDRPVEIIETIQEFKVIIPLLKTQ